MMKNIGYTTLGFGLGAGVGATYIAYKALKYETALDKLKNALLTLALMKVNEKDIAHLNYDYQSFDGTQLPSISGCSIVNGCFSYIINKFNFRFNNFMYSEMMMDKLKAIDRYLNRNLGTDKQVQEFFTVYITQQQQQGEDDNMEEVVDEQKMDDDGSVE